MGFHDWSDYSPFYKRKFLSVGQKDRKEEKAAEEIQKLFSISFPEFAIKDPKTFVKVLQDKRITDLRQLVQNAVDENVTIDVQFAKIVLKEVLHQERKTSKYRNISSYLTIPLDFLGLFPGVGALIGKVAEESIGLVIDRKMKKKFRWFYLLTDIVEKGG